MGDLYHRWWLGEGADVSKTGMTFKFDYDDLMVIASALAAYRDELIQLDEYPEEQVRAKILFDHIEETIDDWDGK